MYYCRAEGREGREGPRRPRRRAADARRRPRFHYTILPLLAVYNITATATSSI